MVTVTGQGRIAVAKYRRFLWKKLARKPREKHRQNQEQAKTKGTSQVLVRLKACIHPCIPVLGLGLDLSRKCAVPSTVSHILVCIYLGDRQTDRQHKSVCLGGSTST